MAQHTDSWCTLVVVVCAFEVVCLSREKQLQTNIRAKLGVFLLKNDKNFKEEEERIPVSLQENLQESKQWPGPRNSFTVL